MADKCNSYQKELPILDNHWPSNKPERLHTDFWPTLYIGGVNTVYISNSPLASCPLTGDTDCNVSLLPTPTQTHDSSVARSVLYKTVHKT